MLYYDYYHSPRGRMLLVADYHALTGVYFTGQKYHPRVDKEATRTADTHAPLRQAKRELSEYFDGKRTRFTSQNRTPRHAVPAGGMEGDCGCSLRSHHCIWRTGTARRPYRGSARAAGAATGRNPVSIIVPCHRIVGSNGSLTGYAGA